jgi:hypothetical protein
VRKALNDNPIAQVAVLGALAVIVAFLLITRMQGSSSGGSSAESTDAGTTSTAPAASAPASGAPASDAAPAEPASPSAAAAAPPAGTTTAAPVGDFVAGPGLPKAVVKAYEDDKAIVLFVFRHRGLDDAAVRASVEQLRGRSDLAVFVTHAANIARYARIAAGVNTSRVPALIVVRPRHLNDGPPTASISYGFQGPGSVAQAVRDALYKGPSNLPYYPR